MILCDSDIRSLVACDWIHVSPFDEERIQPASIDLTLSPDIRSFNQNSVRTIDLKSDTDYSWQDHIPPKGHVVFPREFLLGCTVEKIRLPNDIVGRIEGKSSLGRLGLIVHATAGYIDPGFEGTITLEITNLNTHPIRIYPNIPIAQLSFHYMRRPARVPYGAGSSKYQNQEGPTPSRYYKNFQKG